MNKYENKSKPIRQLMNSPDVNVAADALSRGVSGLHQAIPNISQSLQTLGSRSLNYLHQKMPKPQTEMIGDSDYEPSKSEQRGWLDLHSIVDNPISALDHVRHGTLTQNHMDALSQVHPELLDEMRKKVMEEMQPDRVKKLPSTTKAALGTFLGSPITESMTPQSILSNQVALKGMQAPQMQGQGPRSTLGGLKELNLAKRAATETTDLEEET